MVQVTESQFQKDPILALSQAIDSGSLYQIRQMIKTLPTAGIAHLIESSPPKTRSVLWQLIDKDSEGEVIQYLNEDLQNDILSELNAEQVAELTEGLETDDLADILQHLSRLRLRSYRPWASKIVIGSKLCFPTMRIPQVD